MKKGTAELVFIVDRSASMSSIASYMEEAIISVLSNQQKEYTGDIGVTFVRFDDKYEKVFSCKPIKEVSKQDVKISPRGITALLDAIGKTLNTFERRFSETDKRDKPEKVLFLIITDGGENASREYSKDKVFGMIKTLERDHQWGFTFIGANQDAIKEGQNLGISRDMSLNYHVTDQGVENMSRDVSNFTASFLSDGNASYSE